MVLHQAAAAFPQITQLELSACACPLPPPSALPKLTTLLLSIPATYDMPGSDGKVHLPPAELLSSVSQYLAQLTDLDISRDKGYKSGPAPPPPLKFPWHHLFTPHTTTHTLTDFTTSDPLTDELLGLLLRSAPALNTLSVSAVQLGSDHSDSAWVLVRLSLTDEQVESHGVYGSVTRLPNCGEGRTEVSFDGEVSLVATSSTVRIT